MFGFSLATAAVVASAYMTTPAGFIPCFALTTFGVDFTLSPSWTVCSDVAGRYTATLSGAMNTMGSIGSFASSVTFPWLLALTGSVKTYFFMAAALDVVAVFGWWRIRPAGSGGS